MYSRHNNQSSPLRWLIGLFVVIAAVAAFSFYQAQQDGFRATSSPTETPTIVPETATAPSAPASAAAAAPKQTVYRIVSEPAQMQTVINEVYYANTDGWDLSFLRDRAGHLQGTPSFGRKGNYVLAGHVELKDGSRGPFAFIHLLKPGDPISLLSDNPDHPVIMRYKVSEIKHVKPNDFEVIRNHGFEELTLITCTDWDGKTYQTRVVVHAIPTESFQQQTIPK